MRAGPRGGRGGRGLVGWSGGRQSGDRRRDDATLTLAGPLEVGTYVQT